MILTYKMLDETTSIKFIAPRSHQNLNPKSEYRNPKQTAAKRILKLRNPKRGSEGALFGTLQLSGFSRFEFVSYFGLGAYQFWTFGLRVSNL